MECPIYDERLYGCRMNRFEGCPHDYDECPLYNQFLHTILDEVVAERTGIPGDVRMGFSTMIGDLGRGDFSGGYS